MFAEDIPDAWIFDTLDHCLKYQNKYLFQSKAPMNMWKHLPNYKNIVVCTTIETNRYYPEIMRDSPSIEDRVWGMSNLRIMGFSRYVTIEPILDFDLEHMVELIKRCDPEQVNIGADSGNNNLPEPPYEKVLELINQLNKSTVVSRKKNLERLEKK